MPYNLRPPQIKLRDGIYASWNAGHINVFAQAPTGFGKTVLFSDMIHSHTAAAAAIVHRQELVTQISLALARNGVHHGLVAPEKVVKNIVSIHMDELGRNFYHASSSKKVVSIDTLIARGDDHDVRRWASQVSLRIDDEGHHVLAENKWGRGVRMFPNALGVGFSAAAVRADGKGLGAHADGIYEDLIVGASMRESIDSGYLTDYRVVTAKADDLDLSDVGTASNGDFNEAAVARAVHRSKKIVGDVVEKYLEYARGKLGITFAVDVAAAKELTNAYIAAGVPAAFITANTPDRERLALLRKFKNRQILQLVNVDLFGEGFDLPAIEVVSMARPTESFQLYGQQFGRALRLMISPILAAAWGTYTDAQRRQFIAESEKPHAIVIDHVGNIFIHKGPPDRIGRVFTLDARERRSSSAPDDAIPLRACDNPLPIEPMLEAAEGRSYKSFISEGLSPAEIIERGYVAADGVHCSEPYERIFQRCPRCGYKPIPAERSRPEHVDGNMFELTPEALAAMRGAVAAAAAANPAIPYGATERVAGGIRKRHNEARDARDALRGKIAEWRGLTGAMHGDDVGESMSRFFLTFGVDVLTAQTLPRKDAEILTKRVDDVVNKMLSLGLYQLEQRT